MQYPGVNPISSRLTFGGVCGNLASQVDRYPHTLIDLVSTFTFIGRDDTQIDKGYFKKIIC